MTDFSNNLLLHPEHATETLLRNTFTKHLELLVLSKQNTFYNNESYYRK